MKKRNIILVFCVSILLLLTLRFIPVSWAVERAATEYATITIKYLDQSSLSGEESAIYSSYIATVEKGSEFAQEVVSPTFLGFAPYYDSDNDGETDDDATTISLGYASVTDDVEIKVYYKPIEVKFAIRYFFQNINDDHYTEDVALYHTGMAETGTIISDEYITEMAGDTKGYEKLYHYPESVAADGSTVFECYYDRHYYLIRFDLDGGYGIEPIYARYGSPFVVNNPIRSGYEFKGWDLLEDKNGDGVPETGDGVAETDFPTTIPAENRYYRALWETVETTATIVYWLEDPDSEGDYNYWGSYKVDVQSGDTLNGKDYRDYSTIASSLDQYEKRYSFFNETKSDEDVVVKGDGSSVINVYYDRNEYELRFYYAMSSGSEADTTYYVIGGSTYFFGYNAGISDTGNEVALLDQYMSGYSGQRGQVDELPTLNENGASRGYTNGTETSTVNGTEYTYYYLSFSSKYGADISSLWPCNVFNSVTRVGKDSSNGWSGEEAFVSAWNGEHHVYYSQNNTGNQTIKGNYNKLDYNLLWKYDSYGDSNTVAYLCFWENGANIGWSVPELYRYNIYVQVLDGQDTSNLTVKEYNGVTYYLLDSYDTCDDSSVNSQTSPALIGYNYVTRDSATITDFDASLYKEAYDVNFYYTREIKELKFYNYNGYVSDKGGNTAFGTAMDNMFFSPEYPDNLEEGAYTFAGWYTTSGCYEGSEFGNFQYDSEGSYVSSDFNDCTMRDEALTLYAKWVPTLHKVNFFTTYEDMLLYESEIAAGGTSTVQTHASFGRIEHGTVVGSVANPEKVSDDNLNLTFAGWFYMDNGTKKAFSSLDMPINRDLNIFADWSSSQPQPYRIEYVLLSNPQVKVADDTTGYAYGGSTRTFSAKAGNPFNQLYEGYNSGYFPTVGSHSITMQYEEDKDNAKVNVYTFYYAESTSIKYTVRYINKETNTLLEEETVNVTSNSVVTERFKAFENMVPDAFYKRLVISVEWDETTKKYVGTEDNVITFYYTPNTTSAYYAVHYMLEKLPDSSLTDEENAERAEMYYIDGTGGYEETGTHIEGIGDVGSNVLIEPQSFSGFKLIEDKAVTVINDVDSSATLTDGHYSVQITASGTELYIFYARQEYDYVVHYYNYNTTTPVSDKYNSVTGSGKYGSEVTVSAPEITGYTCVSALTTQTITIRDKVEQNEIIFFYSPAQYVAEYVAVPADGGWLSSTIEVVTGNGVLAGSVPTANGYYKFTGWYLDEECTQSAADYGTIDSTTGKFTPAKDKLSSYQRNIFYAGFVCEVSDLTIVRSDATDESQVFVYEVKNTDTADIIYVTVTGNDSVTICELPYGTYTITQQNNWSWRYGDEAEEINHKSPEGTTVIFEQTPGTEQWLNGNSPLIQNTRRASE